MSDFDLRDVKVYLETCNELGVVPVSYFVRHMKDETLVMRHHGLGPLGAKAIALPLVVSMMTSFTPSVMLFQHSTFMFHTRFLQSHSHNYHLNHQQIFKTKYDIFLFLLQTKPHLLHFLWVFYLLDFTSRLIRMCWIWIWRTIGWKLKEACIWQRCSKKTATLHTWLVSSKICSYV